MQQLIKIIVEFFLALFRSTKSEVKTEKPETRVKEKVSRVKNIDLIKEHEGLRLKAYLPTVDDVWTIGYGHTRNVYPGMVITNKQAEEFLKEDLDWVESTIKTHVKVPLNQNQYDALASLIYNIGSGAFAGSTLLKKLNAGDYQGAADQFLVWNKQKGKTLKGLVDRRKRERSLFLA